MYFIDKSVHLTEFNAFFSLHLGHQKKQTNMENYVIVLGMYLILMLFLKIWISATVEE